MGNPSRRWTFLAAISPETSGGTLSVAGSGAGEASPLSAAGSAAGEGWASGTSSAPGEDSRAISTPSRTTAARTHKTIRFAVGRSMTAVPREK